jgi:hypothetical protein
MKNILLTLLIVISSHITFSGCAPLFMLKDSNFTKIGNNYDVDNLDKIYWKFMYGVSYIGGYLNIINITDNDTIKINLDNHLSQYKSI